MYVLYKKRKEVADNFLGSFHFSGADYPPRIFAKYPPSQNSAKDLILAKWRALWIGGGYLAGYFISWPDYPPPLKIDEGPASFKVACSLYRPRIFGRIIQVQGRIIRPPRIIRPHEGPDYPVQVAPTARFSEGV